MNDNEYRLECNHVFHTKCIVDWFRRGNATCPTCRSVPPDHARVERFGYLDTVARASLLRRRYRSAPDALKRLIENVRTAEERLRETRQQVRRFRSEHHDVFKTANTLLTRMHKQRRAVRQALRRLGTFTSIDYPLYVEE